MFSQACVKNSVRGGICGIHPPAHACPPGMHTPGHACPPWILRDLVNERVVQILLECILVTTCNEVGARLCFYTCGCHFVHGGGGLPQCMLGYHPPSPAADTPPKEQTPSSPPPPGSRHPPDSPWEQTPLPASPWEQTPPGSSACWEIRATSGRYASYWNAFLFENSFFLLMYFMFLPLS